MTAKVNEEFVVGLVGAMKEKSFVNADGVTKVKVRYMGDFYARGPVFKVEGTKFEGTANEIEEACIRSGCSLEILKRKEDRIIEEATSK